MTITAWVRNIRKLRTRTFIDVTDGTLPGHHILEAVLSAEIREDLQSNGQLRKGSALRLQGTFHRQDRSTRDQLVVTQASIVAPNESETHPIFNSNVINRADPPPNLVEVFRKNAHLRITHPRYASILRIRAALEAAMATHLDDAHFTKVIPPIMTASDCEGAGETFRVVEALSSKKANCNTDAQSTSPSASASSSHSHSPAPTTTAHLTVSSQLHLEALLLGLGRVYCIAPAFRAEKSATNRHLREFYMCEVEQLTSPANGTSDGDDELDQIIDTAENLIKAGITSTIQSRSLDWNSLFPDTATNANASDSAPPHHQTIVINSADAQRPWPRITYADALARLTNAADAPKPSPQWGDNLSSDHEKWLARDGPIFVTNYPAHTKPFYMRLSPSQSQSPDDNDKATVACFDLLLPNLGEVAGGSLREDSPTILLQRMKDLNLIHQQAQSVPQDHPLYWYIVELRKYAMPPHGGFGIGMDRLVSFVAGEDSVRECVPFPRVGKQQVTF